MTTQTNGTHAFIIKDDTLIAVVETELKNGTEVQFGYGKIYDDLAHCELLVNSKSAKISRAKKWFKLYNSDCFVDEATQIDNDATPSFFVEKSLQEMQAFDEEIHTLNTAINADIFVNSTDNTQTPY